MNMQLPFTLKQIEATFISPHPPPGGTYDMLADRVVKHLLPYVGHLLLVLLHGVQDGVQLRCVERNFGAVGGLPWPHTIAV